MKPKVEEGTKPQPSDRAEQRKALLVRIFRERREKEADEMLEDAIVNE